MESTKKSGRPIWMGADMSAKVLGIPPDFLVLSYRLTNSNAASNILTLLLMLVR
jgi:hypothetical protein